MSADRSRMRVMLASPYDEKRVSYPCYVQPKLDGIRAYYKKGKLYSRDRKLLQAASFIADELATLKLPEEVILDGELYHHGWPLQRINGACGVNRIEVTEDTKQIRFAIFDVIKQDVSFAKRWAFMQEHLATNIAHLAHSYIVYPQAVNNKLEADAWYTEYKTEGFEGMIYRVGDCMYTPGKRNLELLKRKDWLDDWFKVVGKYKGKTTELGSKFVNTLGGVICRVGDKTFNVGSGFTDEEREHIWEGYKTISECHVRFERYSEDGIPLKGTVIEWR